MWDKIDMVNEVIAFVVEGKCNGTHYTDNSVR